MDISSEGYTILNPGGDTTVSVSKKYNAAIYTILIIFLILTFFPLIFAILLSVKSNQEIITGSMFALPKEISFSNYYTAWIKGKVNSYFINSVVVTVLSSVLTLVLGFPLAYGLCRLRWKMKNSIFTIIIIGIMIPIYSTLIPVFIILKNMGILNSYFAIILPYTASALPITVFVVRNFLIGVPYEMEQAAFIDGCSVARSFVSIVIPTIKHATVTVIVLNVLTFWNEYVMAATLIKTPSFYTLPVGLQAFQGIYVVDYGAVAAGVVISVIPVLIIYLVFNDLVDKGIVAGALK
jgi:raffinose/stachyose/melibiose transport system permease protein